MTIGKKISLGFAAVVAITAISGYVSRHALVGIRDVANDITNNSLVGYRAVVGINDKAQSNETDLTELLDGPDAPTAQAILKDIQDNSAALEEDVTQYENAIGDDSVDAKNFDKLKDLRKSFEANFAQVLAVYQSGKL
jgi:CHASE3 domain sensor protein